MIQIKKFIFNPVQVNTYVLFTENEECLIIDPGCYFEEEFKTLYKFIDENKLKPIGMIATHFHFDHLMGCAAIAKKYGIQLSGNAGYKLLFEHMDIKLQAELFGFEMEMPPLPKKELSDGDSIYLDKSELKVLYIPGHSPCCIALYCKAENFVLTGDILFNGSIGRTDLYMGDFDLLIHGIKQKLLVLKNETKVYPGHGDETTIGKEKHNNPYL
jgi:hydroxyacylglutathione hydrolase